MTEERKLFPLTVPQRTLLCSQIYTLEPVQVREFNAISWYFSVKGEGCEGLLQGAFRRLILSNDALRLRFVFRFPGVRQYVNEYTPEDLPVVTLPSQAALSQAMNDWCDMHSVRFFDERLYNAVIFSYEGGATLFMRLSHYVFDGYSMGLAARQLEKYLEQQADSAAAGKAPRKYTIEDYMQENAKYRKSERHRHDMQYCRKQYRSCPHLSRAVPRRRSRGDVGDKCYRMDNSLYLKVEAYCRETGIPVSFFCMSLIALVIGKMSGKRALSVAQILHGRTTYLQKQLMGCMMYLSPVFFRMEQDQTVALFLKESYLEYIDSSLHGAITPFERLLNSLPFALKHLDPNYYGIMYSVLELKPATDKSRFSYGTLPHKNLPHQLYISFSEQRGESVTLYIDYQSRLFSSRQIDDAWNQLVGLAEYLTENSNCTLDELFALSR